MRQLGKSAISFLAIGLALYVAVYAAAESLMYRNGRSNAFFKIATASGADFDWVILGASHAMPLDFDGFNDEMQHDTGLRIINLAAPGTGPLYNRFALQDFLSRHRAKNLLYVVDSFALYSRTWNEDRFSDAKLLRGMPFSWSLASNFWSYVRDENVDPRALVDYVAGFSKINDRERFKRDVWEGELQFERVYRSSATAIKNRITYLYPQPPSPTALSRYLGVLSDVIAAAERAGMRVVVIKMPIPAAYRSQLPNERAFDEAISKLLVRRGLSLRDFSGAVDDAGAYLDTDHLNRKGVSAFYADHLKSILLGSAEARSHREFMSAHASWAR